MGQINVIEYNGRPGPNHVTIIQGMHGEETQRINGATLAVDELDKSLTLGLEEITGKLILIPNTNAPGCAFRTYNQPDPKRGRHPTA